MRDVLKYTLLGIIIVVVIILMVWMCQASYDSYTANSVEFQKVTLYQLLSFILSVMTTIVVAVYIGYYSVQKQNNKRKKLDSIEKILLIIQNIANRKEFYLGIDNRELNLMNIRSLSNKIDILRKIGEQFEFADDIE